MAVGVVYRTHKEGRAIEGAGREPIDWQDTDCPHCSRKPRTDSLSVVRVANFQRSISTECRDVILRGGICDPLVHVWRCKADALGVVCGHTVIRPRRITDVFGPFLECPSGGPLISHVIQRSASAKLQGVRSKVGQHRHGYSGGSYRFPAGVMCDFIVDTLENALSNAPIALQTFERETHTLRSGCKAPVEQGIGVFGILAIVIDIVARNGAEIARRRFIVASGLDDCDPDRCLLRKTGCDGEAGVPSSNDYIVEGVIALSANSQTLGNDNELVNP